MSAFTFTRENDPQVGRAISADHKGYRRVRGTLTGPDSYDSGGSDLPRLEIREIFDLHVLADIDAADIDHGGHALRLVPGDPGSVEVYDSAGDEVTAATDLSDHSFKVEIIGK